MKKDDNEQKKYTITIIDEDNVINVCLNDLNKQTITFGRDDSNDIVLSSMLVSARHGYFNLSNNDIEVVDSGSTNGIFVNNSKENRFKLKDGDSIKIDNPDFPLKRGIVMILSLGNRLNEWHFYDLYNKNVVVIGRGDNADIPLDHVSVFLEHAEIIKKQDNYYISNRKSMGTVLINGIILMGEVVLRERDVILIANSKFIYNKERLIYQSYDFGANLEAIDIVKTVKVNGKKRNISEHVNLSIKAGEFVAFVGGSGAGKSTFMNCISGVSKPTSGTVLLNGDELYSNYSVLKDIIGYVPQQDIVYTDLTLKDMLRYAASLRMPDDATALEKQKRINDVLETVELSDKKDVMIRDLSGGQRKRSSIAVELIADPKLFFLDEPTSGLDPGTERSIMYTLRKMADNGKTVILVTHTTLNLHLCDKVVFFGPGGKMCYAGPPNDALSFFNVNDFVDIYNVISEDVDKWYNLFNQKREVATGDIAQGNNNKTKKKNQKSFFNQFIILSRRYLKTILNNKQQLLLLILQAPLIAWLLSIVITSDLFSSYEEAKTVLFSLATASIWLGLLNSIQEICKERVILTKEYMANLKLNAYLASKIVIQSLLGLLQAFLLVTTLTFLIGDVPEGGIIFSWYFEMFLVCFLTIVSASSIGLLVSTFSKTSSGAMSFAPLLLVPQLLFSGMLFNLNGAVEKISNFILCRWSVEAFGTTNDLNSLTDAIQKTVPSYVREEEIYYFFTPEHFFNDIMMILLMAFVLWFICYFILKRQLERGK